MIPISHVLGCLVGSILATVFTIFALEIPATYTIGMSVGTLIVLAGYRKKI